MHLDANYIVTIFLNNLTFQTFREVYFPLQSMLLDVFDMFTKKKVLCLGCLLIYTSKSISYIRSS